MATLFQIIPKAIFNPLAAPGATVYAEVLLRLFEETRRHQPLSRDLAVDLIVELLLDPEILIFTSKAKKEPPNEEGEAVQARPAISAKLVPRCISDSVMIEPYRNYAARLEEFYVA